MEPDPARHARNAIPAIAAALARWLDFEPLWRMHRRLRRQRLREDAW